METAIGAFDSSRRARLTVDRLSELGYDHHQLGYARLAGPDEIEGDVPAPSSVDDGRDSVTEPVFEESARGAVGGAAGGAAAGAMTGILASAGLLAVPGLGPLLAAGTLATSLGAAATGGVAGAAVGGVAGAIWGASADDEPEGEEGLALYRRVVGAGGAVVTVNVPDGYGEGMALQLEQFGARATTVYRQA